MRKHRPSSPLRVFLLIALAHFGAGGVLAAERLPLLTIEAQAVDVGFPIEAVVEAVQQTTIGAQSPGRIVELRVDAGQAVRQGEVLLRIDAREAAEAARAADAQYQVARQNLERQRQLLAQKFVSQAAVDRAHADFAAAAANQRAAQASQSHATIVAPLSGIVAVRHVETGDMAMPGTPLLTLYQPGSLRVTASVPQSRLPALRGVSMARVEFPGTGQTVMATAVQILPTADAATHATPVRVLLPALPAVLPGMAARVHFQTGRAAKLSVPASAIVRRGEVAAVYVEHPARGLSLRQLRLGETLANGEIEVLAGLTAGEQIVTDPVRAALALQQGKRAAGR